VGTFKNLGERGRKTAQSKIILKGQTPIVNGPPVLVHSTLGPGFLESVYQNALVHDLRKAGLVVESQRRIQVTYDAVPTSSILLILSRITTMKAERVVTFDPVGAAPLPFATRREAVEPVASIRAVAERFGSRGAPVSLDRKAGESAAMRFVALETMGHRDQLAAISAVQPATAAFARPWLEEVHVAPSTYWQPGRELPVCI
jgi:hypothetical protein